MPALILANGEIKDEIIQRGAEALRNGTSAADVAEQVARDVEDDADDMSVGFSGLPNVLGEVELDASFMDGATLRAGAVAAVRDFRHPISIARAVLERLPHVLLVGDGAMRFGAEIGAERRVMLTPAARRTWRDRMERLNVEQYGFVFEGDQLVPLPGARPQDLISMARRAIEFQEGGDTMNVIVRDAAGHIVSAVTTSGIAWKYPGRAGDAPIIGAGNYADDRYGAAACMGFGELTMRHGSTVRAIQLMQLGHSLQDTGRLIARDLAVLQKDSARSDTRDRTRSGVWVRMLMLDAHGQCGGFSTASHALTYKVQATEDAAPREHACWTVPA